ncbi:MAG TPA: GH92 family glycosyl hydrolase [Flavisolibacter sp.]|nr:GH92 family glycosyl hydrolase [Flavisolibacter sp.]
MPGTVADSLIDVFEKGAMESQDAANLIAENAKKAGITCKTNEMIMMKKIMAAVMLFGSAANAQLVEKVSDPVEWVNPLMGTDSKVSLSNGNTYPAICLPWGMNFWTPQTGVMGNGWQYQYSADKIRGFKQTHQPSPWMNDYGQFSIMPVTGKARFRQDERASWFSHKTEIAKPYYYSVYLADADVTTEIAPTERAAQFRFTFPRSDSSFLIIDAFDKGSFVQILPEQQKIIGYSTRYSRGNLVNFKNYFEIRVDKPFTLHYVWHDSVAVKDSLQTSAFHAGAVIGFKTAKGEKVHLSVASSFISPEQAALNLSREIGSDGFDQTRQKAKKAWNDVLSKISVEGGTEEQVRTFYSCLYRTVQFPQKLYEADAGGKIVHWSPYNGQVLPGRMFGGTGFWDTFRALYPFLNLMYPDINREMQEGLVNDFKEGGWLPEWSSPGYANIMIGNNSASVVADAYIKGLRGYDIGTLYEALRKGADNEGPIDAVGRKGASYYKELGYVPYDVKINESAARSLEYCYDDFTIYQLAKALRRPRVELDYYAARSLNYKKLFDPETKLMRGKNRDGSFMSPFNPFKWGDAFTEGNSWHYSWSVFHVFEGLKQLMGGDKAFVAMLDSVFTMPPSYDESYYGGVIHEIREMQIMNMGQYAHGNQPIQHMLYLYNYAGEPWKTQYWVREAMKRLYKPTPDGYCGDEDNGQTSAWYVFSALGFYPVCPGTSQYVLGTPLFRKTKLHFGNGKELVISAPGNGSERPYVQSVKLNGLLHHKNWVDHYNLLKGGSLDFSLSPLPNKQRGTDRSAFPYSFSLHENVK